MKKETTRQSNFELMRIVSMFMIVVWHLILHGNLLANTTGTLHLILQFVLFLIVIHVNSFVLVSGYFQCKSKMKLGKAIQLNNAMWFYKAVLLILFVSMGFYKLDIVTTIKTLSPINYNDYWFMVYYIILYLISPILNIIINNINRKTYTKILFTLFIILCIFAPFTNEVLFNNRQGYSLENFIFLYLIGGYFRRYPIDQNIFMSKITTNGKRLIYIFLFIFIALINFSICKLGENLSILGSISKEIGETVVNASLSYDNLLVIIQTILFFLFFSTFNFKSKFINRCAGCVLSIYLIHENALVIPLLYKFLRLYPINNYGISILYKIFIYAIIIFVVCIVIEFIRQLVFKFIYNRNLSKKFRKWYRCYIKSLGFYINW